MILHAFKKKSKQGIVTPKQDIELINSKEKPTLCTELTSHWKARTEEQNLYPSSPVSAIFAYRTEANSFETFARWFALEEFRRGIEIIRQTPTNPGIRSLTVCALDQGLLLEPASN